MPEIRAGVGIAITEDSDNDIIFVNSAQSQNTEFIEGAADLDSGTATGGSTLTLIDTSKSWTVNAYADKIAKIQINGANVFVYGIIESNTSNTITFDDELIFRGSITVTAGMTYQIIDSIILLEEDQPAYLSADLTYGNIGIILDTIESDSPINGVETFITVETAPGQPVELVVIARGTQRIRKVSKYGVLISNNEGASLVPISTVDTPYWANPKIFGVERFATSYLSGANTFTSTSYVNALTYDDLVVDFKRRFEKIDVSGKAELEYNSIVPNVYEIYFRTSLTRVSGSGTATLAIAKKDGVSGVETILSEREIFGSFSATNTTLSLTVSSPVSLQGQDTVYPVIKLSGGSVSVNTGSEFQAEGL